MATPAQWIEGARPRTLPAAVSPVVLGTGVALWADSVAWGRAALALVVALALQVAVNYANDYSDGIRGTDADRVGPLRLVGSGVASPAAVKRAAFAAFGVAAVVGLILAVTVSWWLVVVGALCILAAWFYTGGSKPYGYLGLGEVMVFCFFGLVAVLGTVYVQTKSLEGQVLLGGLAAAIGIGAIACALLVANNLRDIPGDSAIGKRTLAVVLGPERTRGLYALLLGAALVAAVGLGLATTPYAAVALVGLGPAVPAVRTVLSGKEGRDLIPVLQQTGMAELAYALLGFLGLLIGR